MRIAHACTLVTVEVWMRSPAWTPPPLVKPVRVGKLSLRMPESLSVEVAAAWKLPDLPACALMYTVVPLTNVLPLADDKDTDGADGPVVSTLTRVETLVTLPTLSVP